MRADAAREATGADAAVINGYAPNWNCWGGSLPAGPVTLHDLATVEIVQIKIGGTRSVLDLDVVDVYDDLLGGVGCRCVELQTGVRVGRGVSRP